MMKSKGVVAIISILLITGILIAMGLTIAAVGQNEIVLSGVIEDGEKAFSIADACTEEGVERFKLDGAYTGGSFALDGGTCVVVVANLGGNNRLVTGTGTYKNAIRIIVANVTLTFNNQGNAKKITVNSWNESN